MYIIFAAALVAAVAISAGIEPARHVPGQGANSMSGQALTCKVADATKIPLEDITGSVPETVAAAGLTRVDGTPLGCDEIRAMDEVELITDDSYCR